MLSKITYRFLPIPLEPEPHEAKLFCTSRLQQKTGREQGEPDRPTGLTDCDVGANRGEVVLGLS